MKVLKAATTLLLFSLMTSIAFAQQGERVKMKRQHQTDMHQMHQQRMQMMSQMLELTEEQRNQMKELHLQMTKEMIPLRNELREKQARMRTLMTGRDANLEGAKNVADEIATLRADQMKLRLETHMKVRSLLDEEQRITFDAMPHFMGAQRQMMHHKTRRDAGN